MDRASFIRSIMATKRLGQKNIDQLLDHYRGERKRLLFQLDKVRTAIAELKAVRVTEGPEPGIKKKVGRPRKDASLTGATPSVTRRRKRRVKTGGYKLSPWDEMVIATIRKGGLLPKEEILKQARVWATKHEPKMKPADVEVKITRVLQKLSGKRGELGTHRTGLRRGYHYGLKEWFFASTGALRKQYLDKLVIRK